VPAEGDEGTKARSKSETPKNSGGDKHFRLKSGPSGGSLVVAGIDAWGCTASRGTQIDLPAAAQNRRDSPSNTLRRDQAAKTMIKGF